MIVPKQSNSGQTVRDSVLRGMVQEWAQRFDGATVFPALRGCWMMRELYAEPHLHCEATMMLEAVRTGPNVDAALLRADGVWVKAFAERIGRTLGQEAVYEQIDMATRTEFRPGKALRDLPADVVQPGPAVTDPLAGVG